MRIVREFAVFLYYIYQSRRILFQLSKNDFKQRYLGTYLGLIWAFVQPLMTILIMWFVFQVGFRAAPIKDFPFILWLISAMIPWFFLSEAITGATGSLYEYSYLIKKVVFRVSTIPLIKILTSLYLHLVFVGLIFVLFLLHRIPLTLHAVQILYYIFASVVLVLGISWITSALTVFLKDIGQIVGIIIQMGFWATPIFWSVGMLPARLVPIMKLNPAFYITEGYRNALIYQVWFWQHWVWTTYFWTVTGLFFVIGAVVFSRLRPHFADVL
jgi:lipopolysaccharide transport system permease protein/teichoic acid transport system permease protein